MAFLCEQAWQSSATALMTQRMDPAGASDHGARRLTMSCSANWVCAFAVHTPSTVAEERREIASMADSPGEFIKLEGITKEYPMGSEIVHALRGVDLAI